MRKKTSLSALFSAAASKVSAALRPKRAATALALVGTLSLLGYSLSRVPPAEQPVAPLLTAAPVPAPAVEKTAAEPSNARSFTFRSGTTFGQLFGEFGLDKAEVPAAVAAVARYVDVRRVRAGDGGLAYFDAAGRLVELRFKVSQKGWLTMTRAAAPAAAPGSSATPAALTTGTADGWTASWRDLVRTVEVRKVEGELRSFLFDDLQRAGGTAQLAYSMSDVLQWDLDFDRDLQLGDRFGVVYEEVALDGVKSGLGRVLALYYENKNKRHEAYLYDGGTGGEPGYYDGEGRPLQKMFLRSPLPFMRVTSNFSHSRLHPVLKVYRPHYGVDLGAPIGTPVRSTAGGTVTFAARNGGAGLMVTVRHAQGYESSYLHLSKIAPGIRVGSRVSQGEILGNVGNSGHSTGAHLDYRIKKNGNYLDPMSLKNQPAEPIGQYQLADFLKHRDRFRASLYDGAPLEGLTLAVAPKPKTALGSVPTQTAR